MIARLYKAGYPLIWLRTSEVHRAKYEIMRALGELPEGIRPSIMGWDILRGAEYYKGEVVGTGKGDVLFPFSNVKEKEVRLVFGYHDFLKRPEVQQATLNFVEQGEPFSTVIFVSPVLPIPPALERYITVVDFALPDEEQLRAELRSFAEVNDVEVEDEDAVVKAGRGLTLFEFVNAIALSLVESVEEDGIRKIKPSTVLKMKEQMVARSSTLQVFHPDNLDEIKGLEIARSFIKKAIETKMGKGVLLVGVPGTGKSLLAKTVGKEMGLPTIILEFANMFGSLVGESEQRLRDALKVVEAMSPCVLMVDEIEKGLAGTQNSRSDGGTGVRLLGMFLKWLNDRKEGEVFVIATANDIEVLPPEFVRAERWDTMFFVDVPAEDELRELFSYYCSKYGVKPPKDYSLYKGYTGAEVKQLCKVAKMFGKSVDEVRDFVKPVVKTQAEKIEKLREWAEGRCVPASLSRVKKSDRVRRVL